MFTRPVMKQKGTMRVYPGFRQAIPRYGAGCLRVTHPFATVPEGTVRLACIRPAASVHPEPGSNSPS